MLLDRGLETHGSTALQVAALMGHGEVARLLIREGADVSSPAVLYHLASHGLEDASMLVMERGADVNGMATRMRGAALHQAARTGHLKLVRVLLDRGANAQTRNHDGRTPLDVALRNDRKDVAELLHSHATSRKEMILIKNMRRDEPKDDLPPPYAMELTC